MLLELLGMGTKLAGGLMGSRQQDKNRAQAQAQFDQQMDHSVSRRVKDAKRAGIHPLFAMGASVGASPTLSGGGSGGDLANAVQSIGTALGVTGMNKAAAQRDIAEAQLMDSERARINQDSNSQGHDDPSASGPSVKTYAYPGEEPKIGPGVYYEPEVPYSQSRGVRAGTAPMMVKAQLPDGRTVELYDPDMGLDEIGQAKYVLERSRHYAADAMMWASKNLNDKAILKRLSNIAVSAGLSDRQIAEKVKKALTRTVPYGSDF